MCDTMTDRNDLSSRFQNAQKHRTLIHPNLPQPTEDDEIHFLNKHGRASSSISSSNNSTTIRQTELDVTQPQHSFVICADSQLGMTSLNLEWETELTYCRQAIEKINELQPRPKFVSICGDIVEMEQSIYYNNPKALRKFDSVEECIRIQDKQNEDFQKVFNLIHDDIALVCLCGNHDIGNRPTPKSIERFRNCFGDEYFAFWTNGSYNICLNNVLFTDPSGAMDIYEEQLKWLEERLQYANKFKALQIFVYGHHPWFLYSDMEDTDDLANHGSPAPKEWEDGSGRFENLVFSDSYFSIPKHHRMHVMELFEKYKVTACFSGHFHQNLISKSRFGMDMIITAPLSMVFESNGKPKQCEPNERGFRVVNVFPRKKDSDDEKRDFGCGAFSHKFISI